MVDCLTHIIWIYLNIRNVTRINNSFLFHCHVWLILKGCRDWAAQWLANSKQTKTLIRQMSLGPNRPISGDTRSFSHRHGGQNMPSALAAHLHQVLFRARGRVAVWAVVLHFSTLDYPRSTGSPTYTWLWPVGPITSLKRQPGPYDSNLDCHPSYCT
jgi:hypothetical protein